MRKTLLAPMAGGAISRGLLLAGLAVGTAVAAGPAAAQAWDPNFPVCLQIFGPFSYNECRFTSLPQCAAAASGRAAECVVNPYFANASGEPRGRRHGRQRRAY